MEPQYNALSNQPCFPCMRTCYPGLPILTHLLVLYSFIVPLPYVYNSCEEGAVFHFIYLHCLFQQRMRGHDSATRKNNPMYLYKDMCI